jgi:flagellar protein FliS
MQTNYQTYFEDEILSADPIRLVQLLYRGALDAVANARANLARNDIRARTGAVSRAFEILVELSCSLNRERGGELSGRLAALYDYMQRRLLEGNQQQADPPFAEVEQILRTLEEAWLNLEAPASMKAVRAEFAEATAGGAGAEERVPVSCAY